MGHSNHFAPTTTQSSQDARPTTRAEMQQAALEPSTCEAIVRDIAERMLSFHTDGTVLATAEVLGLDMNKLWNHFIDHSDPMILGRTADPVVLAYLTVKGFEDWCMDQLAESYSNSEEDA